MARNPRAAAAMQLVGQFVDGPKIYKKPGAKEYHEMSDEERVRLFLEARPKHRGPGVDILLAGYFKSMPDWVKAEVQKRDPSLPDLHSVGPGARNAHYLKAQKIVRSLMK